MSNSKITSSGKKRKVRPQNSLVGIGYIQIVLVVVLVSVCGAQGQITDQVGVVIQSNHVVGVTSGQGLVRFRLRAGEEIILAEAKGLNAVVQTSRRVLGFSGILRRWKEKRLDSGEKVKDVHVTPRLVMVLTNTRALGFQAETGRWKMEEFTVREILNQKTVHSHVVALITDHRVLGFSAFTGGFFAEDLQSNEKIRDIQGNDNIIVLQTSSRTLIFRSQLTLWTSVQ